MSASSLGFHALMALAAAEPEAEHGLAFDVMVYLAAAVVCVPIAKRLGLGSVLGYLAAGCVIGPWGLRFVTNVESTMHFSEFGVVLMLFVIGLELEPHHEHHQHHLWMSCGGPEERPVARPRCLCRSVIRQRHSGRL